MLRAVGLGHRLEPGPVDGVVRAVVQIGRIARERDLVIAGNPIEQRLRTIECTMHLAESTAFLECLLRPGAGDHVVGGPGGGEEVHRDHGELARGAVLQEHHLVGIGDSGEGATGFGGLLEDRIDLLAPVAVLEDADTGSVEVPDVLLELLEDGFGKDGRSRGEVQDPVVVGHLGPRDGEVVGMVSSLRFQDLRWRRRGRCPGFRSPRLRPAKASHPAGCGRRPILRLRRSGSPSPRH